jgi:uncharacterized protein (DUF2252 family)
MATVYKRIKCFNSDRPLELVKLKYRKMRDNELNFYRGSCHLFYEDLPTQSFIIKSPLAWICGDLHLENFGSYKADNRLVYFDINDFDESALAPCLLDAARILTGILVAAEWLHIDTHTAFELCKIYLEQYAQTLAQGFARLIEKDTAQGTIKYFLEHRQNRNRKDFIDNHTESNDGKLKLRIDEKHIHKVDKHLKKWIATVMDQWAKRKVDPDFFEVLDVGYRLAGTGSLGLERYVLLVAGKGKESRYLLDMKIANPSCLTLYLKTSQPKWPNEAERIIRIQKRMQTFPIALLGSVDFNGKWFVLRELQPDEDKLDLSAFDGKTNELESALRSLAEVTAWDHLRGCSRDGSAIPDELIEFAGLYSKWKKSFFDYCREYAQQAQKNFQAFSAAYDDGYFDPS